MSETKRGDIVVCIEAPDYLEGLSVGTEYVVNHVIQKHDSRYFMILGDDLRGHSFLSRLFKLRTPAPDAVREALEPFAEIAKEIHPVMKDDEKNNMMWAVPKVGDIRRAAKLYAALSKPAGEE